jgi:nucleotide-binding universal stress UspA family protein
MESERPLILASTDFSPPARNALTAAAALARRISGRILLVHSLELPDENTIAGKTMMRLVDVAAEKRKGDDALRAEAKAAKVEDVLEGVESITEDPGRGVPALALARHCDLIVIGTTGREGLKHVVLGSVAEKILRRSSLPVLVVPMRGKEAAKAN